MELSGVFIKVPRRSKSVGSSRSKKIGIRKDHDGNEYRFRYGAKDKFKVKFREVSESLLPGTEMLLLVASVMFSPSKEWLCIMKWLDGMLVHSVKDMI